MTDAEFKELIFQALGEASMCWEYPERAGEFQTSKALDIGFRLFDAMEKYSAAREARDV